jgi:Lipopolysaccharide-assembly
MILKNKMVNSEWSIVNDQSSTVNGQWSMLNRLKLLMLLTSCCWLFSYATCKYSFKDTSPIPEEVKTFRVNYLDNKAPYVNPQLSPALTEKLKQKIIGNTRLRQTNDDNAHYDISGYVSDYSVSTSGITGNTSGTNRLTVSFHLIFKNTLDDKKDFEAEVPYTLDFDSNRTLSEIESARNDEIVTNVVDAIFNKIFSNW